MTSTVVLNATATCSALTFPCGLNLQPSTTMPAAVLYRGGQGDAQKPSSHEATAAELGSGWLS